MRIFIDSCVIVCTNVQDTNKNEKDFKKVSRRPAVQHLIKYRRAWSQSPSSTPWSDWLHSGLESIRNEHPSSAYTTFNPVRSNCEVSFGLFCDTMASEHDEAVLWTIFNPTSPFGDVPGLNQEEELADDGTSRVMPETNTRAHVFNKPTSCLCLCVLSDHTTMIFSPQMIALTLIC